MKKKQPSNPIEERGLNVLEELTAPGLDDVEKINERSAIYEAIRDLYDGKNLHFITELSQDEVKNIVKIMMLYRWEGSNVSELKEMCQLYMKLMVSNKRKGRLEFFDALKNMMAESQQEQGVMQRMFTPSPK